MAQGEECAALREVKEEQGHQKDRLTKLETIVYDVMVPGMDEVKTVVKGLENTVNSSAIKGAELTGQLSNLSIKIDGLVNQQQKPSLALEFFRDGVKVIINIIILGAIYSYIKFFQ